MPKSLVKKAAKGWNPKLQKSKPAAPNIPGLVTELNFPDGPRDKQLAVVQQLRYLLNLKYELTVADQIIATGAIPRLVDLLLLDDICQFQLSQALHAKSQFYQYRTDIIHHR